MFNQNYDEVSIILPRPHLQQEKFLNCGAKRVVVKAGRRGGKTIGVAILAVKAFLKGKRVLYATPTQEQIDRFWSTVSGILQPGIDKKIYRKNETRHIIDLPGTEQRIRAKTAWDADSLRGDYADILILDEYQLMNEDAWEVVGAPMLLDNNGDAYFVFTPPSFRTAGVSKAKNKKHASLMYKKALNSRNKRWAAFHFTSYDNPYISHEALEGLQEDMTALAIRQEIMAEDIEEIPGALWTRKLLDRQRTSKAPNFVKIYISIDPKTEETAVSETGIVGVALGDDGNGYVLDDSSLNSSPTKWAEQAVAAYHRLDASAILAEVNQGGDMVVSTLDNVEKNLPIKRIRATKGKQLRAEPVSILYERGKVFHLGEFPFLEEQMCSWVPGDKSPDRLDALVQGLTALLVKGQRGWSRGAG